MGQSVLHFVNLDARIAFVIFLFYPHPFQRPPGRRWKRTNDLAESLPLHSCCGVPKRSGAALTPRFPPTPAGSRDDIPTNKDRDGKTRCIPVHHLYSKVTSPPQLTASITRSVIRLFFLETPCRGGAQAALPTAGLAWPASNASADVLFGPMVRDAKGQSSNR